MNVRELIDWLRQTPDAEYNPGDPYNCAVYHFLRHKGEGVHSVTSSAWYEMDDTVHPLNWSKAHHCSAYTHGQLADLLEEYEL